MALRSALGQGFLHYKGNTLINNTLRSAIHSSKRSECHLLVSDVIRIPETSVACNMNGVLLGTRKDDKIRGVIYIPANPIDIYQKFPHPQ